MDGQGQVVARVAALLTEIDRAGPAGARLLDLGQATAIARSSIHRILADLISVGFVQQTAGRRYVLGARLLGLNSLQSDTVIAVEKLQEVAQQLATRTGDTVYVAQRLGASARYLVRADGAYPVRAQIVDVGQTLPLGSTLSGIALVAGWEDSELRLALEEATATGERPPRLFRKEADWLAAFRRFDAQIQQHGFCYVRDLVWPGVSGVAAPCASRRGRPRLAMSISAIDARMPPERAQEIGPWLVEAAQALSQALME